MFDKELSKKFLAKIVVMSDKELQQRAEKASSSGMAPIIEEMIEFNSERIEEDLKGHMFLITSENKDTISVEDIENSIIKNTCKACKEGYLLPRTDEKEYEHLGVTHTILASFLSCNSCGASIITREDRKKFKDQVNSIKGKV